ncbi:MAG: hypothetical protein NC914_03085, partial [Candidatus Omnitrophica bacterium]|nr:hypothetical protein [Candidatus Omnitrophota bacterium]
MYKVGIIGVGVVGHAVYKSLNDKGVDILPYDKYKNIGNFDSMLNTDVVFLCLPTLYNTELQSYDKSAVDEVCSLLSKEKYKGLVVIKSTVEPTTSQFFANKYGVSIVHNPE